jgi:lipoyl(octanoyl) transferase
LEPFQRINPCGYAGLQVTRLVDLAPGVTLKQVADQLAPAIAGDLGLRTSGAEDDPWPEG